MAEEAQPGSQSATEAAAAAVSSDAQTQAILAKHASGAKLSPAERGKLGGIARAKNALLRLAGVGGDPAQPGGAPAPARDQAAVGAGSAAQAQADVGSSLPDVPPDPGLVKRTTATLLQCGDQIGRRVIAWQGRKAGADDKTLATLDRAAALPVDAKAVMVETSPDVAAVLGIDPRQYPVVVFCGALGLWGSNLALAIVELKELQAQREGKGKAEDRRPKTEGYADADGRNGDPSKQPYNPPPPKQGMAPKFLTGGSPWLK